MTFTPNRVDGRVAPVEYSTPSQTFISLSHETICLAYEEALKRGFDAAYGRSEDDGQQLGYWVEIYVCSLDELSDILGAIEQSTLWSNKDMTA